MSDEDRILNAAMVYSKEEVLAEFQECCESEAETPGQCTERLKLAAEDLCQMLKGKTAGLVIARQREHD